MYLNLFIRQWIILVLVIGGRDYITHQKAIYTWYISGIYCQLGDYILSTTLYKNLKSRLIYVVICHLSTVKTTKTYEHSPKPRSFSSDISYESTVPSHVRTMMTLTSTTINPCQPASIMECHECCERCVTT